MGSFSLFALVVAAALTGIADANLIYDLNGNWTIIRADGDYVIGRVPGGIYTDLMNAGVIDDVFFGYNDNSSRWIGRRNWTYCTAVELNETIKAYTQRNIVFEGLDTYADVYLNGIRIGSSNNMFVRYVFDVRDALEVGKNNITVVFRSPIEAALELYQKQLERYRVPQECPNDVYNGECHVNMLRKMQASFSWDWGPAFPSVGIWKDTYIEAFNVALMRDLVTHVVEKDDTTWSFYADIYFEAGGTDTVTGTVLLTIKLDSSTMQWRKDVNATRNGYGELVWNTTLTIPKNQAKFWWPNGYGSQNLYEFTVDFQRLPDEEPQTRTIKVGFRTVELVQDNLDDGATFYFKVNGVPIFAKGSNEIPISILPERGTDPQAARTLLQQAKEVHMNMLRVWGGGVYESDEFYQAADELGIMIWQDFMFACSMYPVNDEYLESVKTEVNLNLKRIYSHPSIVVYAGNNENEGALADNWYDTSGNYSLYKRDYVTLYIDTVKAEFDKVTKGRGIFVSSSPSNGKQAQADGWVSKSPGSSKYGDVHYYNYLTDAWSTTTYPVPRFCSEYGYQSFPFQSSWLTTTNNITELYINGKFMSYRQHHPLGNAEMDLLILENLNLPSFDSVNYTRGIFYLSQVLQSQAIRIETEHYRRYRSYLNENGEGYTMGALYWQLNDVWVAPTWSSIDFTGRWKMLHYFAKDMFSPVIITAHIDWQPSGHVKVYTVNDQLSVLENVTLVTKVFKYDSPDFQPMSENRTLLTLAPACSELRDTIKIDEYLSSYNCGSPQTADQNCFFYFELEKDGSRISPSNYIFPVKLKYSNLSSPDVKVSSVKKTGTRVFEIVVTSTNIALFVWLDSQDVRGRFSENGFLLVQPTRTLWFYSDQEDVQADQLQKSLDLTHLKDSRWS
ncbi:beta-mannosidase-like [Rhynchophorus ferrugineus]|uniref:beta-mannosidase-like n=1 Tax=Rhynchophorus ferrugineus TaxID=354439 RepID=UPI003FCDAA22